MSAPKRSPAKTKKPSPLHIEAFKDRVVIEGDIYDSVQSEIVVDGEHIASSLPHLTHKFKDRAAHITSSRVVSISGPYVIHQRFHQNEDGLSEPTHDRFFAVETATGIVHDVAYDFTVGVHVGKNDVKPMRGHLLAQTSKVMAKLTFTVGAPDEKHPPLSPRSTRRTVPDKGYS